MIDVHVHSSLFSFTKISSRITFVHHDASPESSLMADWPKKQKTIILPYNIGIYYNTSKQVTGDRHFM
jgi:hypothetical protein